MRKVLENINKKIILIKCTLSETRRSSQLITYHLSLFAYRLSLIIIWAARRCQPFILCSAVGLSSLMRAIMRRTAVRLYGPALVNACLCITEPRRGSISVENGAHGLVGAPHGVL